MENTILNNRYRIIKFLDTDLFSNKYIGKDTISKKNITIEIMHPGVIKDKNLLGNFISELKLIKKLKKDNIVIVHDVGYEKNMYYIITEYIDGLSLKQISNEKAITYSDSVNIIIQLCNILEVFHQNNIVHKRLNPNSILFTKDNLLKISDFGISKLITPELLSQSEKSIDYMKYASPEQLGWLKVDEKSDIYSLGIILYEMLTGQVPFYNSNPSILLSKQMHEMPINPINDNNLIPEILGNIILKTLEKKPELRYQNMNELSNVLTAFLTEYPKKVSYDQISHKSSENINSFNNDLKSIETNETSKIKKLKNYYNKNKKMVLISLSTTIIIFTLILAFIIYKVVDNKNTKDFVSEHNKKAENFLNNYNFKKAENEINKSLDKESKLKNDLTISKTYNLSGLYHLNQFEYKKAEDFFKKAISISEDTNNNELSSNIYSNMSNLYSDLGQFEESKKYIDKNKKIIKSNISKAYYNYSLGNYYFKKGEFIEAEKYIEKSLDYCNKNDIQIEDSLNIKFSALNFYLETFNYKQAEYIKEELEDTINKKFDNNNLYAAKLYHFSGSIDDNNGKYSDSEKSINKAIKITKNLYGDSNFSIINLYIDLAKNLDNQGKYKESEEYYKKSLKISKSLYGNNNKLISDIYKGLIEIYSIQSKYKDAEKYLKDNIKVTENIFGKNSLEVGISYKNAGTFYKNINKYNKAKNYYLDSQNITEKIVDKKSFWTIDLYSTLGIYYSEINVFDKGEKYLSDAVEIAEDVFGENHFLTSVTYKNLAFSYYNIFPEFIDDTKKYADKSYDIVTDSFEETNPFYIDLSYLYASIHVNNGEYSKAETIYTNILNTFEAEYDDENPKYLNLYLNLSYLHRIQDGLNKSLDYLDKALKLSKTLYGENNDYTANIYDYIGLNYNDLSQSKKAEENYKKSLDLFKKIYDEDNFFMTAILYGNLGLLNTNIENQKQAIDMFTKLYGENHIRVASAYLNMATIYSKKEDTKNAEIYYKKSLNINSKIFGDYYYEVAFAYQELSAIYYNANKKEESRKYLEKSIASYEKVYGEDHEITKGLQDELDKYF
ncbi:MAG: tetratricopeptide repeat protein [Clostridiales bacterium]